jgi:hypothetical protein
MLPASAACERVTRRSLGGIVVAGDRRKSSREQSMNVRRQVYLGEAEDRALADESQRTGLSVSQLIRRAVERCYPETHAPSIITLRELSARLKDIPRPDDKFADDLEAIQAAQPRAGKPEWPS